MKLTKEWIAGFVDGNGYFTIIKSKSSALSHHFLVSQDKKSLDVLYALKKEFGCGNVYLAGGTMYNYVISKEEHVRDICIPFFFTYPLQSKKKYEFQRWTNSFQEYIKTRDKRTEISATSVSEEYKLSAGWFRGFVDAQGCFYASLVEGRIMLRFILGAGLEEKELIKECHSLIKCGTLHTNNFSILQVSRLEDLEKKLVPFFETRGSAVLLRTRKRIAFQKFRKIVRLMMENRHLHPEGFDKCKKYVYALNKENQLFNSSNALIVQDKVQTSWKQEEISP